MKINFFGIFFFPLSNSTSLSCELYNNLPILRNSLDLHYANYTKTDHFYSSSFCTVGEGTFRVGAYPYYADDVKSTSKRQLASRHRRRLIPLRSAKRLFLREFAHKKQRMTKPFAVSNRVMLVTVD